jgi:hypothetical protein
MKALWGNRTILIQKALPLYKTILQLSWCDSQDTFNKQIDASRCTFLLSHNLGIMYALNQEYTKGKICSCCLSRISIKFHIQFFVALRLLDACLELCSEKRHTKMNDTLKPFHVIQKGFCLCAYTMYFFFSESRSTQPRFSLRAIRRPFSCNANLSGIDRYKKKNIVFVLGFFEMLTCG